MSLANGKLITSRHAQDGELQELAIKHDSIMVSSKHLAIHRMASSGSCHFPPHPFIHDAGFLFEKKLYVFSLNLDGSRLSSRHGQGGELFF